MPADFPVLEKKQACRYTHTIASKHTELTTSHITFIHYVHKFINIVVVWAVIASDCTISTYQYKNSTKMASLSSLVASSC